MASKENLRRHEINRERLCILCLKKASRSKPFKKVTPKGQVEKMLGSHFKYNAKDIHLPNGLCEGCRTNHVQREIKKGGHTFNRNACKQLLNKVDMLRSICSLGCLKYVKVLDDFRSVVNAFFGTVLDPDFAILISKFKESYLALEISTTPKAHAVFFHVPQFCSKYNKALGFYNKQTMESIHFEFKSFREKYEVNPEEYSKRLLQAVCEINTFHL